MRASPLTIPLGLILALACGGGGGGSATEGTTSSGGTEGTTTTTTSGAPTEGTSTEGTTASGGTEGGGTSSTGGSTTSAGTSSGETASSTSSGTTGSEGSSGTSEGGSSSGTTGDVAPNCEGQVMCTGDTVWSKRVGSKAPPATIDTLTAVAVAPDGTIVIAGVANGTIDFGAAGTVSGPTTAFVAQLTSEGEYVWARGLHAKTNIEIWGIGLDGLGRPTITGAANGAIDLGDLQLPGDASNWDALVASFDAQGNTRFARTYGAPGKLELATDVAVDEDGASAITGYFNAGINFGGNQLSATAGSSDVFVAVFDAEGQHTWSRRFGDESTQLGLGAAFTAGGDVVVAARNYKTIDFGGQPMMTTAAGALALARLGGADGAPVWARQFESTGKGNLGYAALDADDAGIWLATYDESAQSHTVDFGKGPVPGGFYLVAFDAAGATQWSRGFTGLRGISGVVRDGGDSVTVVGAIEGTLDLGEGPVMGEGDYDALVAKYDVADGGLRWARVVGSYDQQGGFQAAHDVGVDAQGHLYVGGTFAGQIHWGDQPLTADGGMGGQDGFLVKLTP